MWGSWLKNDPYNFTANINRLISRARLARVPIIWVWQEFRPDLEDAFLVMRDRQIHRTISGTFGCQILRELNRESTDYQIIKKRYSAFYNTGLDSLLEELGVTDLILSGINTHACIRMSAIDAYQRDYRVVIPEECVLSSDKKHHDVTLRYLGPEIARISSLDHVLADATR